MCDGRTEYIGRVIHPRSGGQAPWARLEPHRKNSARKPKASRVAPPSPAPAEVEADEPEIDPWAEREALDAARLKEEARLAAEAEAMARVMEAAEAKRAGLAEVSEA